MYGVTINALDTVEQRTDFHVWEQVRKVALERPGARPGADPLGR